MGLSSSTDGGDTFVTDQFLPNQDHRQRTSVRNAAVDEISFVFTSVCVVSV